jgi:hypothetical protein
MQIPFISVIENDQIIFTKDRALNALLRARHESGYPEQHAGKEHFGSEPVYSMQQPKGCKRESGCLDIGAGPRQPCVKLLDYIY